MQVWHWRGWPLARNRTLPVRHLRRAMDPMASPLSRSGGLKRGHVDDETVLHVALEHALEGFVDVLDTDHFDVRDDVVLGAEIEHLLSLCDTANERASQTATLENEVENAWRWVRGFGRAHQGHGCVSLEQG